MFNKIPQKEMLEFNRVLGLLLSAKLSFISSLELMAPKIENIQLKKIVSEINKEIKNGQPISKCFAKYKDLFPDSYIANLKIGVAIPKFDGIFPNQIEQITIHWRIRLDLNPPDGNPGERIFDGQSAG